MGLRILVWLLALAHAQSAGGAFAADREEAVFRSAKACQECHPEIYASWRSSQHAHAFLDPVFQLAYDRIRRENPEHGLPCEHCHNPLAFFLETDDPKAAVFAQEGVTCDFCHSVEFVIQGSGEPGFLGAGFPRYLVTPGIKFGPYPAEREPGKGAHRTKFATLHLLSVFCAGCHEYWNEHGIPILSTYSEWEESYYRGKSVHCQFCHLPELFDAKFIDSDGKRGRVSHDMVGGHSRDRLARAIPIRATLTRNGAEAQVAIRVKNDFVGHKTPSGIPIHRLRLETTLYDDSRAVLGRREEVFERVLGDAEGNPLRTPELIFTAARKVLKDNRIGPKETRQVVHRFPVGGKRPGTAEVALLYEIYLPGDSPGLQSSAMAVSRILVPVQTLKSWHLVAILVLAAAAALFGGWMILRRGRGKAPGTAVISGE